MGRPASTMIAVCFAALAAPLGAQDRNVEITRLADGSESRWALVIGNAGYSDAPLNNPLNDATAMASTLRELGFAVEHHEDADRRTMRESIRGFAKRLQTGGVGVFYYAGHGVQLDGVNFLVPVGADVESEIDIPYETVNLGFLLNHMGQADDRLNVVILDACRDNPWRSFRTLRRGLADPGRVPSGTLIAYATAPGGVADDGSGLHSPFTEHLLAALQVPGLPIEEVMKRTRTAVKDATEGRQWPWTSSSFIGDFVPRPPAPPEPVVLPEPPAEVDFSLADLRAWEEQLAKMGEAFEETVSFEASATSLARKIAAWNLFLETFATDDPLSSDDDAWRREARDRLRLLDAEEAAARQARPAAVPPTVPAGGRARSAGDSWEDPQLAGLGMVWRFIPAGTFQMGSPPEEVDQDDDETLHRVELTKSFWMSETEVTQGQWQALFRNNPSHFKECDDSCPVEMVNWHEAVAFCQRPVGSRGPGVLLRGFRRQWQGGG